MREEIQRLLMMSEPEALPLNAQAALGPPLVPQRSQFQHLLRHFLERFFNHETASPDGDAKTRMVLIAFAAGLPPLMVSIYLWPVYHPFTGWPPGTHNSGPPPYWIQVNHHFFFIVYSFVAIGVATVFEWDMFFPDLLDIFVLGTLPIPDRRIFFARVAAIALFTGAFLLDSSFLAPLVLPAATDPPNLPRFLAGHLAAVAMGGLFSAAFLLAVEGVLLSVFGERLFRRFSLALQGFAIAALLVLLLLFPVFSGIVPALLRSGSRFVFLCPPFWFLGIYQRVMEGPSTLPIYSQLARIGCMATLLAVSVAVLAYPLAYIRRVRALTVGPGALSLRGRVGSPLERLLNAGFIRLPVRRAVFHFISQTILRVPRYRIYLVLYGGVGLSVVTATILRFEVVRSRVQAEISADGVRAAIAIVAFWTIAGLRMAFVSPGNQHGSWVFRAVHGRPPRFSVALDQLLASKAWVFLTSTALTLGAVAVLQSIAPPELRTRPAVASLYLIAAGMCMLLTDIFFLGVTVIPFTGESPRGQSNLAFAILKFYFFFPFVSVLPIIFEPWIEARVWRFPIAVAVIAAAHLLLQARYRKIVREHCDLPALEDGEEDFPMKLGLRY